MTHIKKKISRKDVPDNFDEDTLKTIARIEENIGVIGLIYMKKNIVEMYTVPETVAINLASILPSLNSAMRNAICELTSKINKLNPMVDRIMDDESVEAVIMTNHEGAPILTNVTIISATNYGASLNQFGRLAQSYIKEVDIFDEILAIRIKTLKREIMFAPDSEFNIIVVQHARNKVMKKETKK